MNQMTKEMIALCQVFSATFLSKKDVNKRKGEITVVIMHSPFGDNGCVEPQLLKYFSYPVKLPFLRGD